MVQGGRGIGATGGGAGSVGGRDVSGIGCWSSQVTRVGVESVLVGLAGGSVANTLCCGVGGSGSCTANTLCCIKGGGSGGGRRGSSSCASSQIHHNLYAGST